MDRHLIVPITPIRCTLVGVSSKSITTRIAVVAAGALCAAVMASAPASADPTTDFVDSLGTAGIGMGDPGQAVALGQSVCPMLSQPGQDMADAAATVADMGGMSLGPATMFTGLAISAFCPSVMTSLGNGESPIPLGLLGGFGF